MLKIFLLTISMELALVATAAEIPVSSPAEILRASGEAKPGDTLVMKDGPWESAAIVFDAHGAPGKPITLRAGTPGKVVLSGKSSVVIGGEHLVVSGLLLQNGTATGDGIKLAGRNNQITDCAVIGGDYKFFVH